MTPDIFKASRVFLKLASQLIEISDLFNYNQPD